MIAELTISEFLQALLRVNLAGTAAVLAVMALRRPARRLFGVQAAYRLWALAILAAVAVLLPPRTMTAPAYAPTAATLAVGPAFAATASPRPATTTSAATIGLTPSPSAARVAISPIEGLFGVWLLGAALSVGVLAWRQRRFLATLGRLRRGDAGLVLAEGAGVGPAVVGCLMPRVVVPADFEQRFTPEEQAVVLAHENAHLARQDARTNGLLVLAQCLCWFNPLVHLAARLVRLDQELACDALVVRRHPAARRRYAEALLKTQIAATPLPLGCYWPAGARHPLEERIAMLKTPAPSAARRLAGLAATIAVCLAGGVAAWASQPVQLVVAKTAPWSRLTIPHASPVARLTQAGPTLTNGSQSQAPSPDVAGDWIGAIKSPDLRMAVHIHKTATGYEGALDSPDQAAYAIPLDHIVVTGDALAFNVPKVRGTFAGKWDADARRWVGQWSQAGVNWALSLSGGTYAPPATVTGLDGSWDTQLAGGAGTIRLGFNIVTDARGTHGTMDSPDQSAWGLPLTDVSRDSNDVTLAYKLADMTITGNLRADGKTITGSFKQYSGSTPIVLTRRAPGAAAPYPAAHAVAQAPKPPVVDVDPKVLAAYAGTYTFAPGLEMTVTVEDGKLFAQITNQAKVELFASSPTDFFWKQVDAKASFAAPTGGQAPYVVLHQGARYLLGQRT
jgi:beta-lactamase regulating signal transducer with metallopeptidase domain